MEHQGHDTTEIISKIRVERRKAQKPRIEKLRRDRINGSLDEIKHLVLEALNKDISRYSKMEKADILEMAVQFLKETQARKRMQRGIRSRVELAAELQDTTPQERHLVAPPQIPHLTKEKLLMGMTTDVNPIQVMSPVVPPFASAPMVAMTAPPTIVWLPYPSPPPSPTEKSNEVADSVIKQSSVSRKEPTPIVTSLSNTTVLPVWRPW